MVTQEWILSQVNCKCNAKELPGIEKIRVYYTEMNSKVRFTIWLENIANQFSGVFSRSAMERNIYLPKGLSAWLRKSIEDSLGVLCDFLNDLGFRSELLYWPEILEKQEVSDVRKETGGPLR